jgi:hypothetical protein
MRSSKYDRFVWLAIGLAIVVMCFFASCTTAEEWQVSALTTRVGWVYGDGSYDARGGKVNNDTDSQAVYVEIEPFAARRWAAEERIRERVRAEQHYRNIMDSAPPPLPPIPAPKPEIPGEAKPK